MSFDYLGRPFYGPMFSSTLPYGYMGDWYEPYSMYRTGLDVPMPPWWSVVPVMAPLGAAKWGSDFYKRNIGGSSSGSSSDRTISNWSTLVKVGLVVGAGVAAYFVYRGVRSSAVMSREAFRGALENR